MKEKNILLLIADGKKTLNGASYLIDNIEVPDSKVPLCLNYDDTKPLGQVKLRVDGVKVYGDIEFSKTLLKQHGIKNLREAFVGVSIVLDKGSADVDEDGKYCHGKIYSVGYHSTLNADERIADLKTQVVGSLRQ